MPEDDSPEPPQQPVDAPGGPDAPGNPQDAPPPEQPITPRAPEASEAVEMLLHRVTFPATKTEIVQRVGGKEIAVGGKRVTMDRLLARVPGDAYATRQTAARLVALEVMRHADAYAKEGAMPTKEDALSGE